MGLAPGSRDLLINCCYRRPQSFGFTFSFPFQYSIMSLLVNHFVLLSGWARQPEKASFTKIKQFSRAGLATNHLKQDRICSEICSGSQEPQ